LLPVNKVHPMSREKRIEAEAQALWRELYDEPAPALADGGEMLELMLTRLPDVSYDRMASPFLRRSVIAGPRRRETKRR
jgi:hypothetical protein